MKSQTGHWARQWTHQHCRQDSPSFGKCDAGKLNQVSEQVMDIAKDYSLHKLDRPDPLNAPVQTGGMFALVPGHTSYAGC